MRPRENCCRCSGGRPPVATRRSRANAAGPAAHRRALSDDLCRSRARCLSQRARRARPPRGTDRDAHLPRGRGSASQAAVLGARAGRAKGRRLVLELGDGGAARPQAGDHHDPNRRGCGRGSARRGPCRQPRQAGRKRDGVFDARPRPRRQAPRTVAGDRAAHRSHCRVVGPGQSVLVVAFSELESAAKPLGMRLMPVRVVRPQDLDAAFATIAAQRPDALLVPAYLVLVTERARIAAFAAASRLPAVYSQDEFVAVGGLASYGVDLPRLAARAAGYVDRILKGTNAADLPIEQPTLFRMTINLKAAKALGLTIPPSLLARADEVIE